MSRSRPPLRLAGLLALALLPVLCLAATTLRVTGLECDRSVAPLGVDDPRPRLAWRLESPERGQRQTAWQVRVASSAEQLARGGADLWDSGRVAGDEQADIAYAGRPLVSSQAVHWQVRVWDRAGAATDWSAPAAWTMGLLDAADWGGAWIGAPAAQPTLRLRREFTVRPGLRRAVAHVTGLGQYELRVNGRQAGADLLSPGWTDYADTVLYDTRLVTDLLRPGANVLGLELADGMHRVVRPPGRFAKFLGSYGDQCARLHLRLEYADDTVETVVTDGAWRGHAGPVTFAGIYGGEDRDARLDQPGWDQPGFAAQDWVPAVAVPGPKGRLQGHGRAAEPVVAIERRAPVQVRQLAPDRWLYDFGQNASFRPRLRLSGPAGAGVRMTGGEVVNADGAIDRGTMGGAHRGSAWWQYTKAGDAAEEWTPQFYYLGSRYLSVELLPAAPGGPLPSVDALEMEIIHSAAAPAGRLATSDATLNRIRDLVRWAQRSNLMSIITDCPHREKLGWLEQTHFNGPALRFEWDLDRLGAKLARDMADAQTPEGLVPNIAPEYTVFKGAFRNAAEWGAAFIAVPWQHYVFTGDDSLLRELYPAMQRYVAFIDARAGTGLLADGLGDWYDQQLGKPGRAYLTPPELTATACLYQDVLLLSRIAAVLGRKDDAARHAAHAGHIREVFNRELRRPGTAGLYGSGSQTSLALPLALGLVEPGDRAAVTAALVRDIEAKRHFSSGAVGIRSLLRALADAGRSDLILARATDPTMPGYAYQLAQGNTTLAESWTAQHGASQNHFFLGPIVEWMYADLAGLAPDEHAPGFRRVLLRPQPLAALDWVEAEHDTVRGTVAVRWERAAGRLRYRVTLPPGSTGRLELPARGDDVLESGAPAAARPGVRALGRQGDRMVYELESGRYEFDAPL